MKKIYIFFKQENTEKIEKIFSKQKALEKNLKTNLNQDATEKRSEIIFKPKGFWKQKIR